MSVEHVGIHVRMPGLSPDEVARRIALAFRLLPSQAPARADLFEPSDELRALLIGRGWTPPEET